MNPTDAAIRSRRLRSRRLRAPQRASGLRGTDRTPEHATPNHDANLDANLDANHVASRDASRDAIEGPIPRVDDLPIDLLTIDPDGVFPDFSGADDLGRERIDRTTWSGGSAVVKRAEGSRREALAREAAVLEALDGQDAVEFLGLHQHERHDELWTADAGRASLADPWSSAPGIRAAGFASGCAALASLHARGWFHGAVALDHLVLDDNGSARWCSLGSAGRISDDGDGERLDRIAITRAAHRLARALPRSRALRGRLHRLGDEADLRRLARSFRHYARRHEGQRSNRLADAFRRTLEKWSLPSEPGETLARTRSVLDRQRTRSVLDRQRTRPLGPGREFPTRITSPGARTVVIIGALGTAVAALVLGWGAFGPGFFGPSSRDTSVLNTDGGNNTDGGAPAGVGPTNTPAGPPAGTPLAELDGRQFPVGRPGDRLIQSDTDCDGRTNVLLLRPATGEIFDFDVSGPRSDRVTGRLVLRDPHATDLLPAAPCGPPTARRLDGSSIPIVIP